ncbi:hypothetical protein FACS18948_2830 [Clostridia bacterium]|nr:hypothetical protein FACS18948_2830 [Clostridia bacterium]
MRSERRMLCIVLCVALCLLSHSGTAVDLYMSGYGIDETEHSANVARFSDILKGYNTIGASIVLFKNGQIIDVYNYGLSNRADKIPVTNDTLFHVASISKMVSAIGLLKLWEFGAFEMDGDISDYFGFKVRNPRYKDTPITARQIMTHTASLIDTGHYARALKGSIVKLSTAFTGSNASTDFSYFKPGTRYDYSNFGGGLLGSLMETFASTTADQWMHEMIYQPLGITASYFYPALPAGTVIARNYSIGTYGMTYDTMASTKYETENDYERHYTYSAGALSISAIDLAKIMMLIAGDGSTNGVRILNSSTVAAMRIPQNFIGSVQTDTNHGLNLNIIEDSIVRGRTLYGHQGKAYGAISAAYCDPVDQSGVVLVTNGCDDSTVNSIARIARDIMREGWKILDRY